MVLQLDQETSEHKRKQVEKKQRFNKRRVEWLIAYMNGELPSLYQMHISEKRNDLLDESQQFTMGKLIQAGIAAKMLLSQEDETITVQDSVSADTPYVIELLMENGITIEELTPQDKKKLRSIMEDAEHARVLFAEKNLGLVSLIAGRRRHLSNTGAVDFDDLVEEGKVGLMIAIDRFDPSMGNMFSTPATWWIDQPIRSYLDSKSKTIRMPTHMNNLYKNIQYALKELRNIYANDADITDEMIAEYCQEHGKDITVEKIQRARAYRRETISYDEAITDKGSSNEKTLADLIESSEDVSNDVINSIGATAEFDRILSLVEDNKKREILRDWYTSDETQDLVILSNVSRKHCLTRERVRQLKSEAEIEIKTKLTKGSAAPTY